MKIFDQLNSSLDAGLSKTVFDHFRNFLMCAFILAIGANELKQHTSHFFGLVPSSYSGIGVIVISCLLILLNLYDGIRKISKFKYHIILIICLIIIYLFFSIRVVEMTWHFRSTG